MNDEREINVKTVMHHFRFDYGIRSGIPLEFAGEVIEFGMQNIRLVLELTILMSEPTSTFSGQLATRDDHRVLRKSDITVFLPAQVKYHIVSSCDETLPAIEPVTQNVFVYVKV